MKICTHHMAIAVHASAGSLRTGITALAVALLLMGCAFGRTAPSDFYMLSPVAEAASNQNTATAQRELLVGIGPVAMPSYLDRPQIVTRDGNSVRIELSEFHRWGEPLENNIPRVLAEDISRHLNGLRVQVFPARTEDSSDLWVGMDINRFDGALNGTATLDAWWSIRDAHGKTLLRGRFAESAPTGDDYASLVRAESELLGRFAAQASAALQRLWHGVQ